MVRPVRARREFNLLVVLLGANDRILSRDRLLDLSRLHDDEVYNRAIDVQILRPRRKIERDAAKPRYIRTERGAGYCFGVPVDTVYEQASARSLCINRSRGDNVVDGGGTVRSIFGNRYSTSHCGVQCRFTGCPTPRSGSRSGGDPC